MTTHEAARIMLNQPERTLWVMDMSDEFEECQYIDYGAPERAYCRIGTQSCRRPRPTYPEPEILKQLRDQMGHGTWSL